MTRNADVSLDAEKFDDSDDDFRDHVKKILRKRSRLAIVRLEIGRDISEEFRKLLVNAVKVENHYIYKDETPLNMKYVFELAGKAPDKAGGGLLYTPYEP